MKSLFLVIVLGLLLCVASLGCSRSTWMKSDGHEAPPDEQVNCVKEVQQATKGEVIEQALLEQRIEQCMLDKGFHRRPWWLMNDLHWHIKEPAY